MATYTSNYAWTKPSGNDNVDISVLNANLDSQDSIMHDAFMNMAQAFSELSTYEVGDIVVYQTTTYKCHTAVTTAGSWTGSTNWQVYKLSEGGGGTSDYPDLTNKPQINGVTLSGNKTASDLSLQDKMQYSTMPTASADNEGKIYQYVGTADANYTNGYYYKCVENSGSYSWQLVENIKEQTPTFSQASTRNNIASGEKLSIMLGKISKFFNDLKTVAFSGNASDLNYDNTTSGLSATKTQGAIDELADEKANEPTEVTWAQWIQKTPQEQATGDWRITDCPWADGNVSIDLMTKLWENPNPAASFAAQNVNVSIANSDFIMILAKWTATENPVQAFWGKVGSGSIAINFGLASASGSRTMQRYADISNTTKITFSDAVDTVGITASATNNNRCIPIAIYGIKTTASVKINAIAMDVSTSADKCMLSDGVTSVEDRLDAKTFGTRIALTDNTPITTTSDGYVSYGCGATSGNYCYLYINNVNVAHATFASNLSALPVSCLFVKKGMTIKFEGVNAYATFYPLS